MNLHFRPIKEDDVEFLINVYHSTRTQELNLVTHWSEDQKKEFIKQQFFAQHNYYQSQFNGGFFSIIEFDNIPIGRLYLFETEKEIRIIDIAIIDSWRNKSYGSTIVKDIIKNAVSQNKIVSIHVEQNNPAKHLYSRLGFEEKPFNNPFYLLMECQSIKF